MQCESDHSSQLLTTACAPTEHDILKEKVFKASEFISWADEVRIYVTDARCGLLSS